MRTTTACGGPRWNTATMAAFMADHPQRAYFSYLIRLAGLRATMEIGVAEGRFSEVLLHASRAPAKLVLVEPFPTPQLAARASGIPVVAGVGAMPVAPASVKAARRMKESVQSWASRGVGNATNITFLKGLSSDVHVLHHVRQRRFDFVYLDGAHDCAPPQTETCHLPSFGSALTPATLTLSCCHV